MLHLLKVYFLGGMKRHGFSGMPSDERGCTKSHRRIGTIGSGRDKHRVWPGQKMPGHVGGVFKTQSGLQIVRINYKYNVIYVLGQSIPGEPGEMVKIFDSNVPSKYDDLYSKFLSATNFIFLFLQAAEKISQILSNMLSRTV